MAIIGWQGAACRVMSCMRCRLDYAVLSTLDVVQNMSKDYKNRCWICAKASRNQRDLGETQHCDIRRSQAMRTCVLSVPWVPWLWPYSMNPGVLKLSGPVQLTVSYQA